MTIYAYYRVSTDRQDYKNQKSGVKRYCDYANVKVDKEYKDEGVSGTVDFKNRNLGKLVKVSKTGDKIITPELSRLSRNMVDTFELVKILSKKGVSIYCVKENMTIDDSAIGLMTMAAFAFSAQVERERIVQRTKEALAKKKAEGVRLGRPFGFSYCFLDAFVDDVIEMRSKGLNKSKIAKEFDCTWTTLHRFMNKRGIK